MRIVDGLESKSEGLPDGFYMFRSGHRMLIHEGALYVPLEALDFWLVLSWMHPLRWVEDETGATWLFMRAAYVAAESPDKAEMLKAIAAKHGCTL